MQDDLARGVGSTGTAGARPLGGFVPTGWCRCASTVACRVRFEQTFGRLSTRGQDELSTESRATERLSVLVLRVTAQDFQTQQPRRRQCPIWAAKCPTDEGRITMATDDREKALEAALAQID